MRLYWLKLLSKPPRSAPFWCAHSTPKRLSHHLRATQTAYWNLSNALIEFFIGQNSPLDSILQSLGSPKTVT
jgi:hypothetical protein